MVRQSDNVDMTALYLERYMNYGLSQEELQSGVPSSALRKPVLIFRPATGIIWNWPSV
ncbi:hypothetical protein [Brucella sp. NF 2810]|uniref:hypothetical protein n=1 Tax=Brucella sp. NF 2810 TaxID=3419591 RepID=UPI003D1694FC